MVGKLESNAKLNLKLRIKLKLKLELSLAILSFLDSARTELLKNVQKHLSFLRLLEAE